MIITEDRTVKLVTVQRDDGQDLTVAQAREAATSTLDANWTPRDFRRENYDRIVVTLVFESEERHPR